MRMCHGRGQGKTVLMYAIDANLEALCDKLVEMGADINAKAVRTSSSVAFTHASRCIVTRPQLTTWFCGMFGRCCSRALPPSPVSFGLEETRCSECKHPRPLLVVDFAGL
eukprot:3707748-Rhodomonas_salina.1